MELYACQGFGNQFPQNMIDKSEKNNVIMANVFGKQFNNYNNNNNNSNNNNNNNIKPYKQHQPPQPISKMQQYSQPNFINSQYVVK